MTNKQKLIAVFLTAFLLTELAILVAFAAPAQNFKKHNPLCPHTTKAKPGKTILDKAKSEKNLSVKTKLGTAWIGEIAKDGNLTK